MEQCVVCWEQNDRENMVVVNPDVDVTVGWFKWACVDCAPVMEEDEQDYDTYMAEMGYQYDVDRDEWV